MLDVQEKTLLFKIRVLKDQKAFAVLLSKHSPALQRFLKMKLPKIEDAEDTYSITVYRFWNYLTASEVESVSGLLFTIARSAVAEFYRSRKTENISFEDHEVAAVDERLGEKIDAQTMVGEELKKLDDETKEMIVMRYLEGWKIKDIANHLGKSETSTRVAMHRAMKKIRLNIKKCE